MISINSCTRLINGDTLVFDSELGNQEKCSTKVIRIGRHIILAVIIIFTLTAFGYSISFPVKCGQEVNGKICAISQGKNICSQSSSTAISIGISVMILGLCMVASYKMLIAGLLLSIILQASYMLPLWLYDDPSYLTATSTSVVMEEMLNCPVLRNATSPYSECWEMFRSKYCPGWILAEMRLCTTFAADCNTENHVWCTDYGYNQYLNYTTIGLVEHCINEEYRWWAYKVNQQYYDLALNLLVNTTAVHILLLTVLGSAVLLYEYLKNKQVMLEVLEEEQEDNN